MISLLVALLILPLLAVSQDQTGCRDINALCQGWRDNGLCVSQKKLLMVHCAQTCGFCTSPAPVVLFPKNTIAKPDFVCGFFAGEPFTSSHRRRQLENTVGDILNAVGGNASSISGSKNSTNAGRPSSGGTNTDSVLNSSSGRLRSGSGIPINFGGSLNNASIKPISGGSNFDDRPSSGNRRPGITDIRPDNNDPPSLGGILSYLNSLLPNVNPTFPVTDPFSSREKPLIPSPSFPVFPSFTFPSSLTLVQTLEVEVSTPTLFNYPTAVIASTAVAFPDASAIPFPVGGGTDADLPSVGVVFTVENTPPGGNPFPVSTRVTDDHKPVPTNIPNPTRVNPFPVPVPITKKATYTINPVTVNPVPVNPVPVTVPVNPGPMNPVSVNPRPLNPVPVNPRPLNPSSVTTNSVEGTIISNILGQGTDSGILKDAFCGSAPITDRFLISAAHCFPDLNKSYRIRLGDLDLSQEGEPNSMPQDVDIEEVIIHPGYRHSTGYRYNDIALLKTRQKIQFSELVYPYCVLPEPMDFTGAPLKVAGFGFVNDTHRSPFLQEAVLEGLNDVLCEEEYLNEGFDLQLRMRYPQLLAGKGIICAGTPGRSACSGDSGGPLTIRDKYGRNYLLGVVSTGLSCLAALPGLYTDVAYHIDWIDEVIFGPQEYK